MKNTMKKTLALALALALCFGLLPTVSLAVVDDKHDFGISNNYIEVTPNYDWPIVYDGQAHDLLNVTVKFNGVLLSKGTDYTVTYKDGTTDPKTGSATEKTDYPILITGIGAYDGTWDSASSGHYATNTQYRILPHVETTVNNDAGWTLDVYGTLTVTSSSMAETMNANNNVDGWSNYKDYIKKAVIQNAGNISADAFNYCENLKEVILSETVQMIGDNAFSSCRNLQSIHAPNSIYMPSSLKTIGATALGSNTYNLTVYLPDGIENFGISNSFFPYNKIYCKSGTTTEATLKASGQEFLLVEYPGFYMKWSDGKCVVTEYAGGEGNITLPAPADTIGDNSYSTIFSRCRYVVTGITIPANISILQGGAFYGIENCTSIVIEPGNLTTLPADVFSPAANAAITIPDTVTTISGDPGGTNALLIVGRNSAALTWAKTNGYTESADGSGTGKRYQIRAVTQPSVTPVTASMDTAHITAVTVTKHDGSFVGGDGKFTFAGLKNGGVALTASAYTVSNDTVTINAPYLEGLGAGTHTITFDYTGVGDDQEAVDPTLTVTIAAMASPALTVKGNDGADVTANCTVVWKNGSGKTLTGDELIVPKDTVLTYTVTPGDALKVGGVQYYKETTGSVTLTTLGQAVPVTLDMQGTVTVTPKDGEAAIPAAAYTVNWYSKSGDSYTKAGTGVTSPMQDAGTKVYYEIVISSAYKDDYPDVDKTETAVAFGNTAKDVPLNPKNNITLNISGTKKSGGAVTADDYTVTWYTRDTSGAFVPTGKTGAKLLGPTAGTDYYYEIAPMDRYDVYTPVLNWLQFCGIPASNDTKITATDAAQSKDIALAEVETTTLTVTVTNAAQVGSSLTLSATQTPWSGYQCGASVCSYGDVWKLVAQDLSDGSATVCKFDTTVKAEDSAGNFAPAYKTVAKGALAEGVSLTLLAEAIPEALPLTITSQYPLRNDRSYGTATLSNGGTEGDFYNIVFTLHNDTKNTDIASDLYTVTPTEVRFTDSTEIASAVSMNDILTLTAEFKDGTQAAWTSSSAQLQVTKKNDGKAFALAYSEYGRVYFTTTTRINHLREAYGIYNSAGNLVDSGSGYTYSGGVTSGKVAAGTYTLAVWREEYCATAPGTLAELNARLDNTGGYLAQSVTVADGVLTRAALGATPTGTSRVLFTADSGFTQETVEAGFGEWTLVKVNYAADTAVVPSGASYEITVTTFPNYWGTETAVFPRRESDHTDAVKDKYISLYVNDKLVDSTVKINTSNGGKVDGFTLCTDEPAGSIYFYVQALAGGEFNITAEGVVRNGSETFNGNGAVGKMILLVKDGEQLHFTSDYLRTKDNGSADSNGNGVWLNTAPNAAVQLYMDGKEIAATQSNSAGFASFCFTMDLDSGVGSVPVHDFWAADHMWTLAGRHELYATATATVGNTPVTYRTATSVMECVTAQAFKPAEITNVTVVTHKEFMRGPSTFYDTVMNWSGAAAPALTSWFWTPYTSQDECEYTFTVTVEDGDAVLKTEKGNYGLMVVTTGEDGTTRTAMLERVDNGNTFAGTVSGKGFFYNSWEITVFSKAERKPVQAESFEVFLDEHGSEKILDPVTGNVVTVSQLYNRIGDEFAGKGDYAEKGALTESDLQTSNAFMFDTYVGILKEIANEFYEIPEAFDWDNLDASAESLTDLYSAFGYSFAYATDVGYENWPVGSYTTTELADDEKMLFKEEITAKDGNVIYTFWKVIPPKEDDGNDKGAAMIHKVNLGPANNSDMLLTVANGSGEAKLMLMYTPPRFSADPTPLIGSLNLFNSNLLKTMSKQAYHNATGNMQIGGPRDTWNVKSEYSNWNMQKNLLNNSYGTGAQQENDRANKATANDYLNALRDAGPKQIGPDKWSAVDNALNTIEAMNKKYGFDNLNDTVNDLLERAQITLNTEWTLHNTDVKKLLEDLYEDAYGTKINTSEDDRYDKLVRALTRGEGYRDAVDLLRALMELQKALNDMGAQGNLFDGKGGTKSRALKDPQGIVYEAVLSNPVAGATATLYERKNNDSEVKWDAENYGQVNPQTTGPDGQFQWFVPEGEWQVRVTAPGGSDLSNGDSSAHPAANIAGDNSTAGWLPVMPVQMGINIPLVSTAEPTVQESTVYESYAEVTFSLFMDVDTLSDDTFTVTDSSGNVIPCTVSYPDEDADPSDNTKTYAKTVRLTPTSGQGFDKTKQYTITASINADAYNNKTLTQNYDSGALQVISDLLTADKTSVSVKAGSTATVTLTLKDKSGNPVSGGSISAVSAATGTATVTATVTTNASGQATFTVTGVKAGSTTITFSMNNTTVTVSVSVTSSGGGGGYSGGGSSGGSSPSTYKPTITETKHGKVTVNPTNPVSGATVTITATPDEGYAVDTVTVKDASGKEIAVTKNADGTYSFKQPAGKVTIKTTFKESAAPERPFDDVKEADWFYDAVYYCFDKGYFKGTDTVTFSPKETMTRAMFATVLWRIAGEPAAEGGKSFNAVEDGKWYTDAVLWASGEGILDGYGDGTFGANDPVTREQMVALLWRYSGKPAGTADLSGYKDADQISDWAKEAFAWAVSVGLVQGKGNGVLDPGGKATRAEVAQIVMNYDTKVK